MDQITQKNKKPLFKITKFKNVRPRTDTHLHDRYPSQNARNAENLHTDENQHHDQGTAEN